MIKRMRLENFYSYRDLELHFDSDDMVAVTGDNGSGKSAFLEALVYAFYGECRGTMDEVSSNFGNGSHSVEVELETPEGTLGVVRMRSSEGKGFFAVYLDGITHARGAEAQEYIVEKFGDLNAFMLTSFFGLSVSKRADTILTVAPSTKLETLQKLAGVYDCLQFGNAAKIKRKEAERSIELKQASLDSMKQSVRSEEEIRADIDTKTDELDSVKTKYKLARGERDSLAVQEEIYRKLVRDRDALEYKRESVDSEYESAKSSLGHLEDDYRDIMDSLKATRTALDEAREAHTYSDTFIADTDKKLSELFDEKAHLHNMIILREHGISDVSDHDATTCPLCNSEVDSSVTDRWDTEIQQFISREQEIDAEVAFLREQKVACEKSLNRIEKLESKIYDHKSSIESRKTQIDTDKLRVKELGLKLEKFDRDIGILNERLETDDLKGVADSIRDLDRELVALSEKIGRYDAVLQLLKVELKDCKKALREISTMESDIKALELDYKAYGVVEKAFSRYEIPLKLLDRMIEELEVRASSVYAEFTQGVVRLKSVEQRGTPGLEWYVLDDKGERPYYLLSTGERVMLFLSIRVALSEILGDRQHDFLVLDEIAANLSQEKTESLVRLVCQVLKKRYSQIFVVNHAPIPDVFNRNLQIMKDSEGVSYCHEGWGNIGSSQG